jgi:hypothetical protein
MKLSGLSLISGLMILLVSTQALALRCVNANDGSVAARDSITQNIPVPADASDGTLIWESPVRTISMTCSHDWSNNAEGVYLYVNPTGSAPAGGTEVGIRYNGQVYTQSSGRITTRNSIPAGAGNNTSFTFTFSVVVLKKGTAPVSGLSSFNNYRVFQMDGVEGLNATPNSNLNYFLSGNVRFIGCFASLAFSPSGTISFGRILANGTVSTEAARKSFSLSATRACSGGYRLRVGYQVISSTPSGTAHPNSYQLSNGLEFSIRDAQTDAELPLAMVFTEFVDLSSAASGSKSYYAHLVRNRSQLAQGPFTISLVANLEYY